MSVAVLMSGLLTGCTSAAIPRSTSSTDGSSRHGTSPATASGKTQLSYPASGFGGYLQGVQSTPVNEVSGQWDVPWISPRSQVGEASTWIAAVGPNGRFIQLGVVEDAVRQSAGGLSVARYTAFWSDTALAFRPRYLGAVFPGDTVSAKLTQSKSGGWVLSFHDLTRGRVISLRSSYGDGLRFVRANWIQEDPPPSLSAPVDGPYPTMSTVTFHLVMANNRPPRLPFDDAEALSSPNDVFLVPTRFAGDSFSLVPASGFAAQYLKDVQPVNTVLGEFNALVETGHWSTPTPARQAVTALKTFIARLSTQRWPSDARGAVLRLEKQEESLVHLLRSWQSAGAAASSPLLKEFEDNAQRNAASADPVRAAVGLPPTS